MEETTFPNHVNSYSERISHRTSRRFALLMAMERPEATDFAKYCKLNRRDLNKPRKIK